MIKKILATTLPAVLLGAFIFCAQSQANTSKAEILTYLDSIAVIAPIGNQAEDIYRKCLFLKFRKKTLSDANFKMIIQDKIIPVYDNFISRSETLQTEIKSEELKAVHQLYTLGARDAAAAFPLMVQSFGVDDAAGKNAIFSRIDKLLQQSAGKFQQWGALLSQLAANNQVSDAQINARLLSKIAKKNAIAPDFNLAAFLKELDLK